MKGLKIFLLLLIASTAFSIDIPKNWILLEKDADAVFYSPDAKRRGDPYKAVELKAGIAEIPDTDINSIFLSFILSSWDTNYKVERIEFDGGEDNVFGYKVDRSPSHSSTYMMMGKEFLANFLIKLTNQKNASLKVIAKGTHPILSGNRIRNRQFSRVILESLSENDRKFLREIAEVYLSNLDLEDSPEYFSKGTKKNYIGKERKYTLEKDEDLFLIMKGKRIRYIGSSGTRETKKELIFSNDDMDSLIFIELKGNTFELKEIETQQDGSVKTIYEDILKPEK